MVFPGWTAPGRWQLLAGLAASALVAISLGMLLAGDVRRALFLATALPLAATTALASLVAAVAWARGLFSSTASSNARLHVVVQALAAAALVTLIALLVPARSLIEQDGSAFAVTADSIRFTHALEVPNAGIYDQGGILHPTVLNLEKRGVLFPALMAALAWTGTDIHQVAYLLNLFFGWLFLFGSACLAGRYLGWPAGLLASGLIAASPLLQVCIRGNTYDVANAALLVILAATFAQCWRTFTLRSLVSLVVVALAVSQLRFESVLTAVLSVAAIALRAAWLTRASPAVNRLLLVTPLLFVPVVWRFAMPIDAELPPTITTLWSLQYLPTNLVAVLSWLFSPVLWKINTPLISWLASAGLLLWLHARWRRSALHASALLWSAFAIVLAALAVLLCNYWGQATNPLTARYFLFVLPIVAVLAALLIVRVSARSVWPMLLAGVLTVWAVVYKSAAARDGWDGIFPLATVRDLTIAAVDRHYRGCNVIVVSDYPSMYLSRGHSALHLGDWVKLVDAGPVLQSLGIEAAMAPLVDQHGVAQEAADTRAYLAEGRVLSTVEAGPLKVTFQELWRAEDPSPCAPRLPISGIDAADLKGAARLWLR